MDYSTMVIDHGGFSCKVGFGSDWFPTAILPSLIATKFTEHYSNPNFRTLYSNSPQFDTVVGHEAVCFEDFSEPTPLFENDLVTDWNNLEKMWYHSFYHLLQVAPEENPLLLSEHILTPKAQNEKMTQICFETFNIPAMKIVTSSELCHASMNWNPKDCLIVEIGYQACIVCPIHNNLPLAQLARKTFISGKQISQHLLESFCTRRNFQPSARASLFSTINRIKNEHAFVSLERRQSTYLEDDSKYYHVLDHGEVFEFGTEITECMELLFDPILAGIDSPGIHQMIFDTIMSCNHDLTQQMFENIIVCGGTAQCPGLIERLQKEIQILANQKYKNQIGSDANSDVVNSCISSVSNSGSNRTGGVCSHRNSRNYSLESKNNAKQNDYDDNHQNVPKVVVRLVDNPDMSTWIGGAILSSSEPFQSRWITKDEYDEAGASYRTRRKLF